MEGKFGWPMGGIRLMGRLTSSWKNEEIFGILQQFERNNGFWRLLEGIRVFCGA